MHTLIFPTYLILKDGTYRATVNGRMFEQDQLQLLRNAKHQTTNWKVTLKYLFANLRYKQPDIGITFKSGTKSYVGMFNPALQRYICEFSIPEVEFNKLCIIRNNLKLLPVFGSNSSEAYYLAEFPKKGMAVISDIDDTMIVTNASSLMKGLKSVTKAYEIVDQMDVLYTDLSKIGWSFHYLTSSPDVLFSTFYPFMQPDNKYNRFPFGTYHCISNHKAFMRSRSRFAHKVDHILNLVSSFPEKDFILIGDNGQHDIQIYSLILQIMGNEAKRIKAIYIRDVTTKQIKRLNAKELQNKSSENVLASNMNLSSDKISFRYFCDGDHLRRLLKRKFDV